MNAWEGETERERFCTLCWWLRAEEASTIFLARKRTTWGYGGGPSSMTDFKKAYSKTKWTSGSVRFNRNVNLHQNHQKGSLHAYDSLPSVCSSWLPCKYANISTEPFMIKTTRGGQNELRRKEGWKWKKLVEYRISLFLGKITPDLKFMIYQKWIPTRQILGAFCSKRTAG